MSHRHLFKNVGGGCAMGCDPFSCDDNYRCACGVEFKLKTSLIGHIHLPEQFEAEEMSETKEAEIKMIYEGQRNPNSTPPIPE